MEWRRAFVRSYLERDVPMFAPRLPAEAIPVGDHARATAQEDFCSYPMVFAASMRAARSRAPPALMKNGPSIANITAPTKNKKARS